MLHLIKQIKIFNLNPLISCQVSKSYKKLSVLAVEELLQNSRLRSHLIHGMNIPLGK
jgi:hypothetical protein